MSLKETLKPFLRSSTVSAGLILLLICLALAWGAGHFFAFFSLEGLLIVGGGVVATAFISFEEEDVRKALDAIARLFKKQAAAPQDLHRDMMAIIYCARLLKEKGMRDLESVLARSGLSDPFVKYGLNMAVSDYAAPDVRAMMETAAEAEYVRAMRPVEILQAMASHAPAYGMVGTLVGMVAMLSHLEGDIGAMGASLAVAFLSTLYGVLSARLIYLPAAAKLHREVEREHFRHHLIIEGIELLVAGRAPLYIQDRLNSFLRLDKQDYIDVFGRSAAPAAAVPMRRPVAA